MVKVITYGTYDLLHFGHIRLLERAKALGDYLIVGVTADDFDKVRGKINVQQSLMERVEAVRATGIADEIIIEEYEGQKIDDIKKYGVDIFTVGSDWVGKFDYLNEYCKVVYLPRTEGVSSSELRAEKRKVKLGVVGDKFIGDKFIKESSFVNGVEAVEFPANVSYDDFIAEVDAVYIVTTPDKHYEQIKKALLNKKHVLCESPIALSVKECKELFALAKENGLILMEAIKTAYSTAYNRLILMAKSGKVGDIISVDATCTSMREANVGDIDFNKSWNSICAWGPTALLPVFQLLGDNYIEMNIITKCSKENKLFDEFTKVNFVYKNAVASVKVAKMAKSEGELIITGTKGYIYVPAPWWKTDYFEIRFENPENNIRQFYQLDGEGIRYEIVAFLKAIESGNVISLINEKTSEAISAITEDFYNGKVKRI